MKIKRYQSGGIYYTPFFRDSVGNSTPQPQESTTNENKDDELIQKEIINVLKENGIPNDVDYFLQKANTFLKKSQTIGSSLIGNKGYDMSDLIRLQSLANRIRHNNQLYTEAVSQIKSEGAGSEVAISNEGNLYVASKDGIKTISASAYYENPDKYQPLTNSQLINLRSNRPELAYNGTILGDLANTVGMKSIVEYVKSTIGAFGTNQNSSQYERYTEKTRNKIEKGFEQLLGLNSPDGIYKVNESSEVSDQGYSDPESLQLAVNYLYKTLPQNMRNVLRANAAAEGLDPNNAEDVQRLLTIAVVEHTNHSRGSKQSLDYQSELSKGRGSSGSTSTSKISEVFGNSVLKNNGLPRETNLVLPGSNIQFHLPTYHYNAIQLAGEAPGKGINTVSLADETFKNLADQAIIDTRGQAYFGNLPLNDITYNGKGILVDNSKGGSVMYVPVDAEGNINFSLLEQISDIQEDIINKRITDPEKLRQRWESEGFTYDPQKRIGVPVGHTLKRFWTQVAYTSTNADIFKNKELNNSIFINKVDNSIIENLGNAYNLSPANKSKSKIDIAAGLFGDSYGSMLFIPLNENQNEALIAGGIGYIDKPDSDIVKARQDAAIAGGAYDPNIGSFHRTLNGTTASDLD